MPETKGLTLEEMDELFGQVGFAAADEALRQKIERDVGLTGLLGDDEPDTVAPYEKKDGLLEKTGDSSPEGERVEKTL